MLCITILSSISLTHSPISQLQAPSKDHLCATQVAKNTVCHGLILSLGLVLIDSSWVFDESLITFSSQCLS